MILASVGFCEYGLSMAFAVSGWTQIKPGTNIVGTKGSHGAITSTFTKCANTTI